MKRERIVETIVYIYTNEISSLTASVHSPALEIYSEDTSLLPNLSPTGFGNALFAFC